MTTLEIYNTKKLPFQYSQKISLKLSVMNLNKATLKSIKLWTRLINKLKKKLNKGNVNYKKERKKWSPDSNKINKSFKKLMEKNWEKSEIKWKNKINCKYNNNNHNKLKYVSFAEMGKKKKGSCSCVLCN